MTDRWCQDPGCSWDQGLSWKGTARWFEGYVGQPRTEGLGRWGCSGLAKVHLHSLRQPSAALPPTPPSEGPSHSPGSKCPSSLWPVPSHAGRGPHGLHHHLRVEARTKQGAPRAAAGEASPEEVPRSSRRQPWQDPPCATLLSACSGPALCMGLAMRGCPEQQGPEVMLRQQGLPQDSRLLASRPL